MQGTKGYLAGSPMLILKLSKKYELLTKVCGSPYIEYRF